MYPSHCGGMVESEEGGGGFVPDDTTAMAFPSDYLAGRNDG